MLDAIGWVATAVFSSSYFFRRDGVLRVIQAVAAGLWIVYGLAISALPVVIANIIVAAAALYSLRAGPLGKNQPDITAYRVQDATSFAEEHPTE